MRKNAITNPINYVLRTRYGQSVSQLSKVRALCVEEVSQLKTNRGSSSVITEILEDKFPNFQSNFPIPNWEQRKPLPNGKYTTTYISKDFESALNAYVKSINVEVGTKRSRMRTDSKLSKHFNIDPVEKVSPANFDNEIFQILDYALKNGAKLFRKGDLEIQF